MLLSVYLGEGFVVVCVLSIVVQCDLTQLLQPLNLMLLMTALGKVGLTVLWDLAPVGGEFSRVSFSLALAFHSL